MKSIKTSNILKILAIVLVIGILATQKDALQYQMSLFGGENNISTDPHRTERVATVDIVYPRLSGEGVDCNTERKDIRNFILTEGTQLCSMSERQVNGLVNDTGYEKEIFCKCISDFCSTNPQPDAFVKCLNKPERL